MMQHVATAKSEVAAFATGAQTNSFSGSESNEQFGKLMQDQKALHSIAGKSEAPPPHSPRKQALQQSVDEIERVPSSTVNEDTKTQIKQTSNEQAETSSSSQAKSGMQSPSDPNVADKKEHHCLDGHAETSDENVSESATNDLIDELEVGDTDLDLVLSSKHNDIEPDVIVAQEWITLVDNLQKLANVDVQSTDVSETDLKSQNLNATEDASSPQKVDDTNVEQSLSMLVDEILSEILTNSELTDLDVREKVAEMLLEKPDILQNLLNSLQIDSQKDVTAQQNSTDVTIDNVTENSSHVASQLVETDEQIDLSSAENKALLRALLVDSEVDKKAAQEPVKLTKSVVSDGLGKVTQAPTIIAPQNELLDEDVEDVQDVQEAQFIQIEPKSVINSSRIDKFVTNNDIKNILNTTDSQQNKVLENIAQRVFDNKVTAEPISPEQVVQQIVIPKVAEIISSVESPSKDFISALKSGLEEFKNQLSKGREPGIDLKTLVSDALEKTTDTGAVVKTSTNLEQVVNSVSQVLDFAQTMNRAIEHQHDQIYSATVREVAQVQGEQSKQIQLNQFESKLDKGMNIAKPEGHQQLAEKVRWMVNTKNLVAEIRLDPAELGSVHVKVAMSGESATVNFVVQSQQARDAVDAATPRLKEMLADKGIELGQSSVRQESDDQQNQGDGELAGQGGGKHESDDAEVPEQFLGQQKIVNGALGGIDYFV